MFGKVRLTDADTGRPYTEHRLTDGLRGFIKIDSERALEVWIPEPGHGNIYKVRKPKVPEGCPEVLVRENSDELTLRAEEVGTLTTFFNVDQKEKGEVGPPLVDYDWHALRHRRRRLGRNV